MTRRLPPVQRAVFLTDLSPAMARALVRCSAMPVLVSGGGARPAGIAQATLDALQRHGLIEERQDRRARPVWRPSQRGVAIIRATRPVWLAAYSPLGYTTDTARALRDEPEVLGLSEADVAKARGDHEDFRAGVDEELLAQRRELEDELRAVRKMAGERGVDIRADVRVIQARVEKMKRRIREQRATLRDAA